MPASIVGQVTDESRAVLPGVTVTATSPALQVPTVTTVSDHQGEYRLTPLPIGTYSLVFELSGFQNVRVDDVRLTQGFTAKLDITLKVGALAETIVVSGAAPIVDVRSAATSTQLVKEALDLIPNARFGYQSIMGQAPGVRQNLDVGGSVITETSGGNPTFRAFGQTAESWQSLEGVVTNSGKKSQSANQIDYFSLEEARVQTVGADAEMPSRGIQLAAVTKSGSNQFHSAMWWSLSGNQLESNNLDADLAARGVSGGNKIRHRSAVSADLGGRLIPDKLWFYEAVNRVANRYQVLNVFQEDGSPGINWTYQTFLNTKVSYQVNQANRLIVFHQLDHLERISPVVTQFSPWDTREIQPWRTDVTKAEWQIVPTSSLVLDAQYGYYGWDSEFYSPVPKLATFDVFTQINHGPNWSFDQQYPHESNHHGRANVTWYRPDLLKGNHEFKAGFDLLQQIIARKDLSRGPISQDYRLTFNNGVPFQIDVRNAPATPVSKDNYLGVFFKDQWVIARTLTLNLGFRYAHDAGFVPAQCREAAAFVEVRSFFPAQCFDRVDLRVWNSVAPRLHAAWDIAGNGKTVLKGGWGRFDHRRDVDPEVSQFNAGTGYFNTYRWRDLNGNLQFDSGEANFDPRGSDYVSNSATGNTSGTSFPIQNPNERQPKQDQFSVALERELMKNFAVRATGVYSRSFNNYWLLNALRPPEVYSIPVTRPDPGQDGRLGTSDDTGASFTYYEYPTELVGQQFERGMFVNDPSYVTKYSSFEIAAAKRLSNRWQGLASYSATRLDEPVAVPGGSAPPSLNPNTFINTNNQSWEWTGKLSGAYFLPADVMVSANFEHRSGDPWRRTVLFTGGRTIPSLALNVEPFAARRLPHLNLTDFRVEKRFTTWAGHKLAVRTNVYNLTNVNTIRTINMRSGPTFGVPTLVMNPRLVEFGGSYEF